MDKKLRYIKEDLRDYLLHKYLYACNYMHALAFFKWRVLFSLSDNKHRLAKVIDSRLENLRKMKKKQADNLEKAENADPFASQSHTAEKEESEDTHTFSDKSLALPDILRYQHIRGALQQDFDEGYGVQDGADEDANVLDEQLAHQPATVNAFEDINWKDPFPKRGTQDKKDDINQDLYNEKALNP